MENNTCYTFDEETGIYTGTTDYVLGIKNEPVLGSGETLEAPPEPEAGKFTRFLKGSWVNEINHTGTIYYKQDGMAHEITEYGVDIPDGVLLTEPPEFAKTHDGKDWIIDCNEMKEAKLSEVARIRKEIETSGVDITGVSCEDFKLSTDDKGQTKVANAYYEAKELLGSLETTDWYTLSGWREVTNADIIVMAKAVRTHVKKSFSEMKRVQEEIEALSTVEDLENYEVVFNMS